jgi:hypothetical protein
MLDSEVSKLSPEAATIGWSVPLYFTFHNINCAKHKPGSDEAGMSAHSPTIDLPYPRRGWMEDALRSRQPVQSPLAATQVARGND